MAQINTLLPSRIRADFAAYAKATGLDAAELARLLISREMQIRRILRPISSATARPSIKKVAFSGRRRKLTAHFHRKKDVTDFDRCAKDAGYSRSAAAKVIFELELKEKWLLKAFSWNPP